MIRPIFSAVLAMSALAVTLGAQTIQTLTTNGLHEPHSVAVNLADNMYYFTDSMNARVMQYDPSGTLSVLTEGGMVFPEGLVFTRGGLVVADASSHQLWSADLLGNTPVVLAGSVLGANDGVGVLAQFNYPVGLALDGAGNIFIADSRNNAVRKMDSTDLVTTVTNGFYEPAAVAVDEAGRLFVADTRNHVIKLVTNGVVTIIAGRLGVSGSQDATPGTNATFQFPRALLWVGGQTGLLVSDSGNHTIRRVVLNPSGTRWTVDTFAGVAGQPGLVDGPLLSGARLNSPRGMARDAEGAIILADLNNDALRRILLPVQSTPLVTPGSGAYNNSITLVITSAVPNVVFRYTTSGAAVTPFSPITGGTVPLLTGGPVPFQVRSYASEYLASTTVSNYYTFFVDPLQISVPGGTFNNSIPVALSTLTAGAVIRYTTDGSTPTASSPVWADGTYELNGPLLARGFRAGFDTTPVASNFFNFVVATPVVTPAGTTATNGVEVTMSSATTGARLYWTIDGTEPTTNSALYAGPFTLATNGTLKVKGFKNGYADSATASSVFNLFVATPVMVPNGATATNDVPVIISCATAGAAVYWTIDGSDPATNNGALYTGPFVLGTNGTLKAKGFKSGFTESQVASAVFSLSVGLPVVTPSSGTATNGVNITITSATAGAGLYWTIDGSEPTTNSARYAGSFTLGTNGTLKVKGFKSGYVDSPTVSGLLNLFVATPVIVPNGAVTNNDVAVTITCATLGAAVYWTIDGTDPATNNGALYTVPFMLGTNGTLKVKGFKTGFVDSQVASAVFNIAAGLPVVTPAGATATNGVSVTITSPTVGVGLYWTIDGTEPTTNSALYAGPFTLGTNGVFKVKAFKNGYVDSPTVSGIFNLFVAAPVIAPNGATSNNDVPVTINCATLGAAVYWTIDGTDPATNNGVLYSGPFVLGTNGTLKVKGFRSGFVDSQVSSAVFNISVAPPVVTPLGATATNEVNVAITSTTTSARLYWTMDGTDPTTNSALYAGPLTLGTNGMLKVKGFKSGYTDSPTVSNVFNLFVDTPTVTSDAGTSINSNIITASTATTGSELRYTLDGTAPATNSTLYTGPLTVTTNSVLKMVGYRPGFLPSATVTRNYQIQVDKPIMNPSGGFFPEGTLVSLSVARLDAKIYYTLNGQDPTPSDSLYTGPFLFSQVYSPGLDLSAVKARAFATNTLPSDIVSGQATSTNANGVGVARDVNAGIGSTVVLPIEVSLQSNVVLRSVQFRAEVSSVGSAPPLVADLQVLGIGTNDFAQVPGPGSSSGVIHWEDSFYRLGNTNGVSFVSRPTAIGPEAELVARGNEVLVLLVVTIPRTAAQGARYHVEVLQPSGTSDGQQQSVPLAPLPGRTITVTNIAYLVGDSSPGAWYNAGDFGNGDLDNSDVNNAAYASAGYHVPPSYTDAFDAMDAFPPDVGAVAGGDGEIRYYDWQYILLRSLRLDTNNYRRSWSASGRVSQTTVLPSGAKKKSLDAGSGPGLVWFRHAKVYATGVTNVVTGSACAMPVYVDVASGYALAGLQFRAMVLPEDGTALPVGVTFTSALNDPYFNVSTGNGVFCAWNAQGSSMFNPKLTGSGNLLGYLHIPIPQNGGAGYHYTVRFVGVDGGDAIPLPYDPLHLPPLYNLESVPAGIWVLGVVGSPPEVISDEWKTNFFGSVDSTNAISTLDYDGDGMSNWQEYLAGTNPKSSNSCLKVLQTWRTNGPLPGMVVNWLSAPGKSYKVDRATSLKNATWTPVASGVLGNGFPVSITDTNPPGKAQFYRIRLEQ